MKISRNWLQTYFEKELPSIDEIDRLLVTHSFETEGIETLDNDQVLDIDVLPNRAHDCLSYQGIANELAGLMGVKSKNTLERYEDISTQSSDSKIDVQIDNAQQCRRYASRVIDGVVVKESPQWLKDRLATMGQRSINNIVDATNYILFDFGQPTHVFDTSKINGPIIVRNAQPDEAITVLGGDELTLDPSMLVIADSQKPLALAGVKGGISAEVGDTTTSVVLEVANFEPISTRTTRTAVGIFTDASKRYENELSPEAVTDAIEALTRLIVQVAGTDTTAVGDIVDEYPTVQELLQVTFTTEHTNRLTGLSVTDQDIADILDRFQYVYTQEPGVFTVNIPPRRYDLRIAEDMIEEIARIYGFDNLVPQSVADIQWNPQINIMSYYQNAVRNILTEQGFSELMTYTFVNKGEIEMQNALASDKKALRTNLTGGFVEALETNSRNAALFGTSRIRVFEFGKVFVDGSEKWHLVIGVNNKDKKTRKQYGHPHEQINAIAHVLNEHFSTDLFIVAKEGEQCVEWNFEAIVAKLPVPTSYADALVISQDQIERTFKPFSLQPFTTRDIALWVPGDVQVSDIEILLNENATDLCQRIDLFDTYAPEGENRISYAFSLVFQAMDRTLTDEEINKIMESITNLCIEKGWEVR